MSDIPIGSSPPDALVPLKKPGQVHSTTAARPVIEKRGAEPNSVQAHTGPVGPSSNVSRMLHAPNCTVASNPAGSAGITRTQHRAAADLTGPRASHSLEGDPKQTGSSSSKQEALLRVARKLINQGTTVGDLPPSLQKAYKKGDKESTVAKLWQGQSHGHALKSAPSCDQASAPTHFASPLVSKDSPDRVSAPYPKAASASERHPSPTQEQLKDTPFKNPEDWRLWAQSAHKVLKQDRHEDTAPTNDGSLAAMLSPGSYAIPGLAVEQPTSTVGDVGQLNHKQMQALHIEQQLHLKEGYEQRHERQREAQAHTGAVQGTIAPYTWSQYGHDIKTVAKGEVVGGSHAVTQMATGLANVVEHPVDTIDGVKKVLGEAGDEVQKHGVSGALSKAGAHVKSHVEQAMNKMDTGGEFVGSTIANAGMLALPGAQVPKFGPGWLTRSLPGLTAPGVTAGPSVMKWASVGVSKVSATAARVPFLAPAVNLATNAVGIPGAVLKAAGETPIGQVVAKGMADIRELANSPVALPSLKRSFSSGVADSPAPASPVRQITLAEGESAVPSNTKAPSSPAESETPPATSAAPPELPKPLRAKLPESVAEKFDETMAHVAARDMTVPLRRGIGGAHDERVFLSELAKEKGIIERKVPHPDVKGATRIFYRLPERDGNLPGCPLKYTPDKKPVYRAKLFSKTVYDPEIIPQPKMRKMGIESAENALAESPGGLGKEWGGLTQDRIKIHGYFTDGKITSFYLDISD